MKTDFVDVSETRKTLTIEIPTDVVDAEIAKVAKGYTKQARLPGFRPGKVPTTIVKQRFREEILHDVMHHLVPRAVDAALQERGIEAIDTPGISDVKLNEGQPLTFTAAIETVPTFDPGDLSTIVLTQPAVQITDESVDRAIEQLRERTGKFEAVEGRPVADRDAVVMDLVRSNASGESERHDGVSLELGKAGNPPGFDENLIGMQPGDTKSFNVHFPEDYPGDLANTDMTYEATIKEIRHRVLPELDDEFAKDVGDFESLAALRERVRRDLQEQAEDSVRRKVRGDLFKELASRVSFELPSSLVDRELDRRVEEFARQLTQQNIDPRQTGVDWGELREAQRASAREAVASALVLDEVARRENITVGDEDVDSRSTTSPSARDGHRRPSGLSWRRTVASPVSLRDYAGRRRLTWPSRVLRWLLTPKALIINGLRKGASLMTGVQ